MNRLVGFLDAKNILELGTSLGISTAYLAASESMPKVYSLEGDRESHKLASDLFSALNLDHINPILGKFSDTLQPTLEEIKPIDIAFIDGHHNKDSTLQYFDLITTYCTEKSVIIVDDIYWSKGMNAAWEIIKKMQNVSMTIDLFFCGLVFFDAKDSQEKHFKIRPDKILFHR